MLNITDTTVRLNVIELKNIKIYFSIFTAENFHTIILTLRFNFNRNVML